MPQQHALASAGMAGLVDARGTFANKSPHDNLQATRVLAECVAVKPHESGISTTVSLRPGAW